MLADEVVAQGIPGYGGDATLFRPVALRIQKAQKYVLAPAFAAVADALSSEYGSLVRAFPFCRLPYPNCWIELAASDRPQFMAATLQAPNFQGRPKRVGFLLTATRADLSAWTAHLFWTLREPLFEDLPGPSAAALAMNFDMHKDLDPVTEADLCKVRRKLRPDVFVDITDHPGWEAAAASVKVAMLRHTHPGIPYYGLPDLTRELQPHQLDEAYDLVAQLARSDWAGEVAFLLAVIGLMNARNAAATVPSDLKRLNRARQKRGERPLFEHHVLHIHQRQQQRAGPEHQGGGHHAIRMHMCSGHWKVRKSGIFFWRPHMRGTGPGFVSKDYKLE